jgi:hypothetical protein
MYIQYSLPLFLGIYMYYVFMPTEQGAFVAVSANAPQNIRIGDKMVEYVDPEKYRIPLLI